MRGLETDHVIWGPIRGIKNAWKCDMKHETHKQTDITTLWLTRPRGPSQWNLHTHPCSSIDFKCYWVNVQKLVLYLFFSFLNFCFEISKRLKIVFRWDIHLLTNFQTGITQRRDSHFCLVSNPPPFHHLAYITIQQTSLLWCSAAPTPKCFKLNLWFSF